MKINKIIFLISFALTGCGENPIEVDFQKPAQQFVELKTNNIAIIPGKIPNPPSKEIMDLLVADIEQQLIRNPQWTVVDLSTQDLRDKLIRQALDESIALSDDQLLQLGKELNASLILTPDLNVSLKITQETQQRTVRLGTGHWNVIEVQHDGKNIPIPIESQRETLVKDVFEVQYFSFSGKIRWVNVETGEILSTIPVLSDFHRSRILAQKGAKGWFSSIFDYLGLKLGFKEELPTKHPVLIELSREPIEQAVKKVINEISPIDLKVATLIYDSGKLDIGYRLAKAGRWQRAADDWERVLSLHPRNLKCLHNLGVAWLVLGDFEQADLYLSEVLKIKEHEPSSDLLQVMDDLEVSPVKETPEEFEELEEDL